MTGPSQTPASQTSSALLDILFTFEHLKSVERQNPLSASNRRENTAEHSWSVALAVLVFHSSAVEPVDLERALALAVVHDLPETFVGDTFVYGDAAQSRSTREARAMETFLGKGDAHREKSHLVALWREYESADTPESRFVFALDVLLPIFMNSRNAENSSWKRHSVSAEMVRARVRVVEKWLPQLAEHAYEAIESGIRNGALLGP